MAAKDHDHVASTGEDAELRKSRSMLDFPRVEITPKH
jgi:hypothetical protein